jgi:hypothetical protein
MEHLMKQWMMTMSGVIGAAMLASCTGKLAPSTEAQTTPATATLAAQVTEVPATRPVFASNETPATQQAPASQSPTPPLPAGHPDISQMMKQPAASSGSLPAGHPDISQMRKPSQSRGAAGAAMPAGVNLPAGHPDLSAMKRAGTATTQPAVTGTLFIRAIQSTPGGPAVGADPVVIELHVQGQVIERIEAKLDDKGTALLNAIPLRLNPQPVVRITHGGVEYTGTSDPMDPSLPNAELQIPVYEATDEQPAWQIKMRHVMVEPTEGGLQVMDMIAIENPSDRAWIGTPTSDGKRATFSIDLPAGAEQIQLVGGAHDCCNKIEGTKVTNTMPLVPGQTQLRIVYGLPATNGKADITVVAPAPTSHLMVMLPDDGTTVIGEGLQAGGSTSMGKGKTRFYKAAGVPAGQQLKLTVSGITAPSAKKVSSVGGGSTQAAQLVAGAGALVIVLFGVAFLFMKGGAKKA